MIHKIYRVTSFEIIGPYLLEVSFDDDTEQRIDLSPILIGELFGPLRELKLFNAARLDPEVHTLVWPNGADLDPATLHDWNEDLPAILASVSRWEAVPV